MVGRLGTKADVLMTESVLGRILETIDSMLLDSDNAGVLLGGQSVSDDNGRYYVIECIAQDSPVGICVGSSEGGLEPTDEDLALFKKNLDRGILMKADVFAHSFSLYKIGETVEDATVLFRE